MPKHDFISDVSFWQVPKKIAALKCQRFLFFFYHFEKVSPLTGFHTRWHCQADFPNFKCFTRCAQEARTSDNAAYSLPPRTRCSVPQHHLIFVCAGPEEALSRSLSAGRTSEGMFPIPLLQYNTITHILCHTLLPLILCQTWRCLTYISQETRQTCVDEDTNGVSP